MVVSGKRKEVFCSTSTPALGLGLGLEKQLSFTVTLLSVTRFPNRPYKYLPLGEAEARRELMKATQFSFLTSVKKEEISSN